MDYERFLDLKKHSPPHSGVDLTWTPDEMFDFQKELTAWAIERGRCAIFADCGLGKTLMQLAWAENVARATDGRTLILTPLAVSHQTVREAERFGIEATRCQDGSPHRITVTNYERLERFKASDFVAVVCDESSILKSFDGVRRKQITEFMRKLPYRLLCTATAAPNDYIELGTSSEALGDMGFMDMLSCYFRNERGAVVSRSRGGGHEGLYRKSSEWRFKGHAELPFWRWVTSWARACRRPSDMGFDDNGFILPGLEEVSHVVKAVRPPEGMLFSVPAQGLQQQREERWRTLDERCEQLAELLRHDDPAIAWCHLNKESALLAKLIPDCVEVSGADSDDQKEEKLLRFLDGNVRVLVTKPKIGAWGLNLQHCAHIGMFPTHSYEQYYQAVRRCWRFGQKRPVRVDLVTTEGEQLVMANLRKKAEKADKMFTVLVSEMHRAERFRQTHRYEKERLPSWL